MIGGTIGKLLLGWLSDRVGIRPTAIGAMVCGALGMFLALVAGSNVWTFYVGMVVFGVGYAGLTVIVPLLVRNSFGSRSYAEIFSWVSTGIFVATSVSFLVYGRIVDLTGSFTWCFYLVIGLYVIAAALIVPAVNLSRSAWVDQNQTSEIGVH
jgi:MFS family permease